MKWDFVFEFFIHSSSELFYKSNQINEIMDKFRYYREDKKNSQTILF